MAEKSAISWTDATFNPWEGCQKVGPGCDHCYAETRNARYGGGTAPNWGPGAPRRRTSAKNWHEPVKWNARAFYECPECHWRGENEASGCPRCAAELHSTRRRVFCASLADVFDNAVDPQWRIDLWDLIDGTPNLDYMLLTKRVGNVKDMVPLRWLQPGGWPKHVWLGATIVNQEEADRDIPKLRLLPAPIRFLSMEPLLGAVDLNQHLLECCGNTVVGAEYMGQREMICCGEPQPRHELDWVIVGGESGPGARPMHPGWARSLRDQCKDADVALHFKQWGEWAPREWWNPRCLKPQCAIKLDGSPVSHDDAPQDVGGYRFELVGKDKAGHLLDGVAHHAFPEVR